MKKAFFALGLLLFSHFASAQDGRVTTRNKEQKASYPFSVLLLGDALALKGVGAKATYQVAQSFSIGLMGKKFQLSSEDDTASWITNSKHDLLVYGLIADFFPMGSTDQRGLYISGAATSAHVETTVQDSLYGEGRSTDDRVGAQITVGYQFAINVAKTANILFQVGAGYGNGGGVQYKYFSGVETKIQDSLLLDLSAGAQF
ncbi:MAG: hypothetical protein AAGB31_14710 [Bdellovibrio sp.]